MVTQNAPQSQGSSRKLLLGARGSLLSRLQSGMVADSLQKAHAGLTVELKIVATTGDKIQDKPLHEFGGKGLFTKELEQVLLKGEADFAVHSYKDVPVTMPLVDASSLVIAATPPREDPRDVLVSTVAKSIAELPQGAVVGTSSLRRAAQLLDARPDLKIEPLRGNVDTRIRKLKEGQYQAVILALAGVKRAGLFDAALMSPIGLDVLLPAAGQGALALQCRRDSNDTLNALRAVHDHNTTVCVDMERAVVQHLGGDCHSPIAALATIDKGEVHLRVVVGTRGGKPPVVRVSATSPLAHANNALRDVLQALDKQHARKLLEAPAA